MDAEQWASLRPCCRRSWGLYCRRDGTRQDYHDDRYHVVQLSRANSHCRATSSRWPMVRANLPHNRPQTPHISRQQKEADFAVLAQPGHHRHHDIRCNHAHKKTDRCKRHYAATPTSMGAGYIWRGTSSTQQKYNATYQRKKTAG